MDISKYDHLLTQVNARSDAARRLSKLREELTELSLVIGRYLDDEREGSRYLPEIEEEMADVLLTLRSAMLAVHPRSAGEVGCWAEMKAARLHSRLLKGEPL